jgi:hypothetical protein
VNSPVNIVISSGGGNGASVGNVWVQNTLTVTTFTSNGTATFTGTTSFIEVDAQFLVGDGSGIANLNASNITSGTVNSAYLETTGVVAQLYGGDANIPQLIIDQWGRVSNAVNVQTQWTPTYLFNIATANGVSIGTLNDPPTGSNLYVLGTANVTTMNVDTLFANTVTIFGLDTLNVYGTSNMNSVYASNLYGNAAGLSNVSGSSVTGNVSSANLALVVTGAAQPNITSVGVLTNLVVQGQVTISNGFAISNLNSSNLVGNVASANVALVVSGAAQPNITSVGTLTGLNIQGLLVASNGSGISNLNSSNLVGNVASANLALVVSQSFQPNIHALGTLIGLNVQGPLIASNGSAISNITGSAVTGNVANADVALLVSGNTQSNITSLGTLVSLDVSGQISGDGYNITNLNPGNISGTVRTAESVTTSSQPNITSVGTLTDLNVQGLAVISNGSAISNLNSSNIYGTVYAAQVVTQNAQPNITSVGTLTGLNIQGLLVVSNGSGISNLNSSNLVGNVANANVALVVSGASQPNITSVGTLTTLYVNGLLGTSDGSGIANVRAANVTGTVATADVVTNPAQVNITSVGTLTSLSVSGVLIAGAFSGNGYALSNINASNVVGHVPLADSVLNPAQPNITSVGTLSNLVVSNSVTTGNVWANSLSITALSGQNPVKFVSDSGSLLMTNTGRIGLNMTNPSSQLEVGATGVSSVAINISDTSIGAGNGVSLTKDASQNMILANQSLADSWLVNYGTTRFRMYSISGQSLLGPVYVGPTITLTPSLSTTFYILGNAYVSNSLTSMNIFATFANITTLNAFSAIVTTGNVGSLNVFTGANVTQLTVSGLANIFSANAQTLNITSANVTSGNVGSLNVFTGANVTQLTVSGLSNLFSANILTANVTTANIGLVVASIGFSGTAFTGGTFQGSTMSGTTITASTGFIGGTFQGTTITGTTITASTGFTGAAFSGGTFQGFTVSGTTITASTGFTGAAFSGGTFQGTTFTASTGFTGAAFTGGTFQGLSANAQTLNTASANITSGNVGSLNVFTGANITTLSVSTISNIVSANILTANLLSANIQTGNASFLNVSLGANITTLTGTLANIATLNTASLNVFSQNVLSLNVSTGANISTLTVSTFANLLSANIITINSASGNITSGNVSFLNVTSTLVVSGISNLQTLNATTVTMLQANVYGGLGANLAQFNVMRAGTSNAANSYIQTLYASNIYSNNVAAIATNVQYLTVTSNILPGVATGNTYLTGNIIVSGNVYTSIGAPLGAGGGYYFSLPSDIATQTPYTGPVYGTTYPLSVGLSNGFTINGTSTLISVSTNGNFVFNTPGTYKISAVFAGSDNITGLALGSNTADVHGTDQGYLYRYTTQITQNPTELIEIPFNVTDVTQYYYLDLFATASGTLKGTTDSSGGTYLTITPLQGGGLATGGPGGTPGTQWISSGSNIYFPNSIGVGAVNPQYNLDVSTGNTATRTLITSNISSLGLYGPTLNIASNVLIQSNLAVGGGSTPLISPPYALYVTGQGYFSQHVSYANFAGYRNRLVNGTFRVAYRANTITVSNTSVFSYSNTWVVDRWRVDVGGLSTSNVSMIVKQDVPLGTTNGFTQCANVYVSRALTGTTGNTWVCPLSQTIESSFIFDFRWGQATGKPAVFSFYANTTVSGDYSVVFRSRQDNTYYANLVSITAGTWASHVIYLPACLIGNWAQPATDGYLDVLIGGVSYGVNSSNNRAVAVTSSWTANPGFAPVSCIGATKWPATTGLVLQVTGPQLEEGTISTPFEVRPLTQTLIYCQRFFETNPDIQYASALGSGRINSVPFVVTKRNNANVAVYRDLSNLTANTNISQFVAYYGDGTLKGTQAINSYLSSDYGFSFNFTNTGSKFMDASIMEAQFVWAADAEIY